MNIIEQIIYIAIVIFAIVVLNPFYFIRPTTRGIIERFGKYNRFANSGLTFVIPFIESLIQVNITEQMANSEKREMITKDNLNATVEAQVYFKVKHDENSVLASQYNVNNVQVQIVALAKTTLRNIIGTLTLTQANSERSRINNELLITLSKEASAWGIEIVRTELKEITPPKDVQETMNKVVKAQNEKIAAVDFATAVETQADGEKRASIKKAEGEKQSSILVAEGQAQAFNLINKSFIENAQTLKKLETVQASLANNTKIIVPSNTELINVIGELAGVPIIKKEK